MNYTDKEYEFVYRQYTGIITKMRVGRIGRSGIKKIAKAALLLTVIIGIKEGVFKNNRFEYDKLDELYKAVFIKYENAAKQTEHTPLYYPFYHLTSDTLWHLSFLSPNSIRKPSTPSAAWVRNNVEYAYLDPALWEMLQDEEYRRRFAEFIVEEKIKTATENSRFPLRTFLAWLVAI